MYSVPLLFSKRVWACVFLCVCKGRGCIRERKRVRDRQTDRDRERKRERQRQTDTQTDTQMERLTDRRMDRLAEKDIEKEVVGAGAREGWGKAQTLRQKKRPSVPRR